MWASTDAKAGARLPYLKKINHLCKRLKRGDDGKVL
jgi:hypothetical protein